MTEVSQLPVHLAEIVSAIERGYDVVRLPPPYAGWFARTGSCKICAGEWFGEGKCMCGADFYTIGEMPDPDVLV